MPRYRVEVDELQRIRREYVVEADDPDAASELAERGETIAEEDAGRYEVVERFVVPETLVEIPLQTFEIEKYEQHTTRHRVRAEAIQQLELVADIIESTYPHDSEGRRMDGDSPVSGADVVDRLAALEESIREALRRHAGDGPR